MKKELIVRAWKDPVFRANLSAEERSTLPENPSGRPVTELEESELDYISGGRPEVTAPIFCRATVRASCTGTIRRCEPWWW